VDPVDPDPMDPDSEPEHWKEGVQFTGMLVSDLVIFVLLHFPLYGGVTAGGVEGDEFTGVLVSSLVILFSYFSSVCRCGSWSWWKGRRRG